MMLLHIIQLPIHADIHVGYERTVYTALESQLLVRLCVIIYPPSRGVAPRPFTISYTTENDTAGIILLHLFVLLFFLRYMPVE